MTCPCDEGKIGNGFDDRVLSPLESEPPKSVHVCATPDVPEPQDNWTVVPGTKGLKVEYLPCYHTAETVGFGFATTSTRLKAEYQGLPGKDIAELRKAGVDVSENTLVPQLAFYGDTNIDALRKHTVWEKYPVVVIECTLYPSLGKSEEVAYYMGHMHWSSIAPLIKSHPSTFFVLTHHSLAMKLRDLHEFEQHIKDSEHFSNFTLWKG